MNYVTLNPDRMFPCTFDFMDRMFGFQVQYNCMTEDHSSLLESLESAEEARSDLEQIISGLKVQAARSKRERMYVPCLN